MSSTRQKKKFSFRMLRLPSIKKTDKTEDDDVPNENTLQQCPPILTPQISQEALNNMFVDFSKSLWHAFNALANEGLVQKSRLKVIVSSIGRELGFEKAETILDSSDEVKLDFLSFFAIIQSDILEKLKDSSEDKQLLSDPDFKQVHEVCWMLCANKSLSRHDSVVSQHEEDCIDESEQPEADRDAPSDTSSNSYQYQLPEEDAFKVWRVFNFFVEGDAAGNVTIPLHLDTEEAEYICKLVIASSGQFNKEKLLICFHNLTQQLTFDIFMELFEKTFACNLSPTAQSYVMKDLYDTVVLDTLKKGMLFKHGYKMKNWKEYYFVLTSKDLKYNITDVGEEMKKCIHFEDSWRIEIPIEESGAKPHRFLLYTATKQFELSAPTIKEKYEWISAFQKVIEHNEDHKDDEVSVQRQMAIDRKRKRETLRKEAQIQTNRFLEVVTLADHRLKYLDEERLASAMLEAKLMEETALRLSEQTRCQELEVDITTKVGEEMQKRRELQELCDEQRKMYDEERLRRTLLLDERDEGARLLSEAKDNIELLEMEKETALEKLKDAAMRLNTAEGIRIKMEDAFAQWKTNH